MLEKWNNEFNKTRMDIENEGTIARWEFPKAKEIFAKPKHIILICKDIREVCVAIKDFKAILNQDLKKVTGEGKNIDEQLERVNEQVNKLQSIQSDVFSVDNKAEWETCYSTFNTQI